MQKYPIWCKVTLVVWMRHQTLEKSHFRKDINTALPWQKDRVAQVPSAWAQMGKNFLYPFSASHSYLFAHWSLQSMSSLLTQVFIKWTSLFPRFHPLPRQSSTALRMILKCPDFVNTIYDFHSIIYKAHIERRDCFLGCMTAWLEVAMWPS